MQRFVDNWSAVLLAPITSIATGLSIDPLQAAKLVGLGAGDFYELTLVEVDANGAEIAWEIVTVTAAAAGALTLAPRAGRAWPQGAAISARLTSAAMARLLVDIQDLQARVAALEPPVDAGGIALTSVIRVTGATNLHGFSIERSMGGIAPAHASAIPGGPAVADAYGELVELWWDDDASVGEYLFVKIAAPSEEGLPFTRMVIGTTEFIVSAADGVDISGGAASAWWNTTTNPLPAGAHTVQFFSA